MKSFLYLVAMILFSPLVVGDKGLRGDPGGSLREPDTTCQEAYRKNPTKDDCLSTKDYYGRPCNFCTQDGDLFCYNSDQAWWAKIFGGTCEGPKSAVISN